MTKPVVTQEEALVFWQSFRNSLAEMFTGENKYTVISKSSIDNCLGLSCNAILKVFKHGQPVKFFGCIFKPVMRKVINWFTGYCKAVGSPLFRCREVHLISNLIDVLKFHSSFLISVLEILRPIMEGRKR